ncbi:MAG TPA: DUF4339 domain-containing protein [Humisphaera sp.]
MPDWYYARQGQQAGPLTQEALARAISAGQVGRQDQVWTDGMAEWRPAGEVPQFAGMFAAAQAPAPAPAPAPSPYGAVAQPAPAPGAYAGYPQQPGYPQQAGGPAAYGAAAAPYVAGPSLGYESADQGTALYVSPRAIEMLRQTKPWVRLFSVLLYIAVGLMGLLAVFQLIAGLLGSSAASSGSGRSRAAAGGIAAVGMFSALFTLAAAGLYYIPAMYLGRYASRIDKLVRSRRQQDFEAALEAQKSYWKFIGILTLVVIVIYAIVFLFVVGGAASRR